MNEMDPRPIQWHRGSYPGDTHRLRGFWYAEIDGDWRIALAMVRDEVPIGYPGRYIGYIYGEPAETVTLREFKDAVVAVRAGVVDAVRGLGL